MAKGWKPFDYDCLHCGGQAEVLTDSTVDGLVYDGDDARCSECGCYGVVQISDDADEANVAWINWHDEPDCACAWCLSHPDPLKDTV